MKVNKIDSSRFPIRKVESVRNVRVGGLAERMGVAKFATLECGHEVGVPHNKPTPEKVGCYFCHKAGAK